MIATHSRSRSMARVARLSPRSGVDGLGLGYRFSLGHFTVHHGETVLFAWCDDGESCSKRPPRDG
jgi:hypothetical protein